MAQPVILFETRRAANGKQVGVATLNAERSLNALSFDMAEGLFQQLQAWRDDPAIACVVLQGAGDKAFCAGGDVIALHRAITQGEDRAVERYFVREYSLDYFIHQFPKPILCWGHGIVMGGGLGMMVGASHRVATETARIAMPEITIGFYPEVGASWFLPRMPGRVGLYLGLTGTHMNAADALFLGLADYFVHNSDKRALYEQLLRIEWQEAPRTNRHLLSDLLRGYRDEHPLPESPVRNHFDLINRITDHDGPEAILADLSARAAGDPWLERGAQTFAKGSPTSAKVIFEVYHRAAYLSLKEVFALELDMTMQFARHPDLGEGIRALLIDKDNRPKWSPATFAEVNDSYVEEHFVSPWPKERHPFRGW